MSESNMDLAAGAEMPQDAVGRKNRAVFRPALASPTAKRAKDRTPAGMFYFPGRCPSCIRLLGEIWSKKGSVVERWDHRCGPVAVEYSIPCPVEEVERAAQFYADQAEILRNSAYERLQSDLAAAMARADMQAVNRLSALLLQSEGSQEPERLLACESELAALRRSLNGAHQDGFVLVQKQVLVERSWSVRMDIPAGTAALCKQVADCTCGGSDRIPPPVELQVDSFEEFPQTPTPFEFYGPLNMLLAFPTGKVAAVSSIDADLPERVLKAAVLDQRDDVEATEQYLQEQNISDSDWQLVTRRPRVRLAWKRLPKVAREEIQRLAGDVAIIPTALPAEMTGLVNSILGHRFDTDNDLRMFIHAQVEGWEYPRAQAKKGTVQQIRTRLRLSDLDDLPEWVTHYLRQFRRPEEAARLVIDGHVTEQNYREKIPPPSEKVRSLFGHAKLPAGAVPAVKEIWRQAGGKGEVPQLFAKLIASAPQEVERGVKLRLITSQNHHLLKGEFRSWSSAVQRYSKVSCALDGIDPTIESQLRLFKDRRGKDGSFLSKSPSLQGWVKDYLLTKKGALPAKIRALLDGRATEENYKSLFSEARGTSTTKAASSKSNSPEQSAGAKAPRVQSSRAKGKRGPAGTPAPEPTLPASNQAKGSSESDRSDLSRILDSLSALHGRIDALERRPVGFSPYGSPLLPYAFDRQPYAGGRSN